jgi:hypothetical protein
VRPKQLNLLSYTCDFQSTARSICYFRVYITSPYSYPLSRLSCRSRHLMVTNLLGSNCWSIRIHSMLSYSILKSPPSHLGAIPDSLGFLICPSSASFTPKLKVFASSIDLISVGFSGYRYLSPASAQFPFQLHCMCDILMVCSRCGQRPSFLPL